MACYNIFFSPTGGTRRVLQALNPDGVEVDISKDATMSLGKDDIAFVAMPCYAGRCPALAIRRLNGVAASGSRAVAVIVYGNRAYEDSLLELADTLERLGFDVCAAVAAIAEHSIIRSIAESRPDEEDRARLASFSRKIQEKLASSPRRPVIIPGNRPYKQAKPADMGVHADKDACMRCGACRKACPAGAIAPQEPWSTDSSKCIGCMRCVGICPSGARRIDEEKRMAITAFLGRTASGRKEAELFL